MDDAFLQKSSFLYLLHQTYAPSAIKIFKDGWLKPSAGSGMTLEGQWSFPGVYFRLVHKFLPHFWFQDPTHTRVSLIFSLDLLKQKNYHFNVTDQGGLIDEEDLPDPFDRYSGQLPEHTRITYTPDRMREFEKDLAEFRIPLHTGLNELVFHDPISLETLVSVFVPSKHWQLSEVRAASPVPVKTSQFLPRKRFLLETGSRREIVPSQNPNWDVGIYCSPLFPPNMSSKTREAKVKDWVLHHRSGNRPDVKNFLACLSHNCGVKESVKERVLKELDKDKTKNMVRTPLHPTNKPQGRKPPSPSLKKAFSNLGAEMQKNFNKIQKTREAALRSETKFLKSPVKQQCSLPTRKLTPEKGKSRTQLSHTGQRA